MAKQSPPTITLILLLTAGFLLPQLGLSALAMGWFALLLPLLGFLCLHLAARQPLTPQYQRLVVWGQPLAAVMALLILSKLIQG